jgi:plasmid stabilization system protein ParE
VTRVTWAPQAVEDVEAIRAYVARDSAHYADLLVQRIIAAVARLESRPVSGRVVPEVGDESLREVIQGRYRIVYRLNRDGVQVVTVFHGASLLRLESGP